MTGFNGLQLLLLAVALAIAVQRLRILWLEAALDTDAFLDAFETALGANQPELAQKIAEACLPAWPARLASELLVRRTQPRARDWLEHELADAASFAFRGRAALLTLGRIAGPLALIGVIVQLGAALHESGLVALQRGLPLRLAFERSLLTFAIGIATTLACFAAAASLGRSARSIAGALQRVAAVLERRVLAEGRDM